MNWQLRLRVALVAGPLNPVISQMHREGPGSCGIIGPQLYVR